MLPEFMNLLRKFYFMRATARSVKIKIILFLQTEGTREGPFLTFCAEAKNLRKNFAKPIDK